MKKTVSLKQIYETEKPIFTNAQGTEFWLHKNLTEYAERKGLKGIVVFYVKSFGEIKILITKNNEPIFESQKLEDVGTHIDIMAINKRTL